MLLKGWKRAPWTGRVEQSTRKLSVGQCAVRGGVGRVNVHLPHWADPPGQFLGNYADNPSSGEIPSFIKNFDGKK